MNPNNNSFPPFANPWKHITAETAINNTEKLVKRGQGDISTK